MQVAHPVVASGVADHSDYQKDPWARLVRTIDALTTVVYAPAGQASAEGRRLIRLHQGITGLDEHGDPYRALDPEAYGWVHATLFETAVTMCRHFADPLSDGDTRRFYDEWRHLGRIYGLPAGTLPEDLDGFWNYYDDMVNTRLRDTKVAAELITSIRNVPPPSGMPLRGAMREPVWRALWAAPAHLAQVATVGTLPPVLRQRLGLRWTATDARVLRALGAAARRAGAAAPRRLRYFPIASNAWAASGGE